MLLEKEEKIVTERVRMECSETEMDDYSLTDNAELLKRRLKSLEDSKEQLDESLKQQVAYYRTLEREMYKLKSEVGQLERQKNRHSVYVFAFYSILASRIPFPLVSRKKNCTDLFALPLESCRWLTKNGVKQNKINQLVFTTRNTNFVAGEVQYGDLQEIDLEVHSDENTWLYLQGSRSDADQILMDRPDGTFLVRRSRTGQYALSIV